MEIYRDIGMAWLETVWSNKIKRRNMERSKKKRKEKEEIKFLVHFFFFSFEYYFVSELTELRVEKYNGIINYILFVIYLVICNVLIVINRCSGNVSLVISNFFARVFVSGFNFNEWISVMLEITINILLVDSINEIINKVRFVNFPDISYVKLSRRVKYDRNEFLPLGKGDEEIKD